MESSEIVYHVNLGNREETVTASGLPVSDVTWHTVHIHRTGLEAILTVDNTTFQRALSGIELTLDVDPMEIYTGGRPLNDGIADGYKGCLQDMRLDGFALPTSGSNSFATVTFVGPTAVIPYCALGVCFPNPCGAGNCTELDDGSYQCLCSDGSQTFGVCPELQTEDENGYTLPIVVGCALGGVILIVICVLVIGERVK